MSDTPRTDQSICGKELYSDFAPDEVIDAEVARTLERELAAAQAQVTAYKIDIKVQQRATTMLECALEEAGKRIAELERERDGGVGYGLTPDDLDRLPYNLERKEEK